jgi:hypothetical protein
MADTPGTPWFGKEAGHVEREERYYESHMLFKMFFDS